jgi:hypothetical protein
MSMSSSMVSSKTTSPPAGYAGDGESSGSVVDATATAAAAATPVTSCLYLHPGAGAMDRDAVLRRIRHRRRHNRLRDTLRSMLLQPPPPPEPESVDGAAERQLPWPLDDAFSAP